MISQKTPSQTAEEAIHLIRETQVQVKRLATIISAVRADAEGGEILNIALLSQIGTRLAETCGNNLMRQITRLQAQLDAVERGL